MKLAEIRALPQGAALVTRDGTDVVYVGTASGPSLTHRSATYAVVQHGNGRRSMELPANLSRAPHPQRRGGRIYLADSDEVTGWIVANVAKVIAAKAAPGHDLHTVTRRLLDDDLLTTVRDLYVEWAAAGKDRPTGIREIGVALIGSYRRKFNI